MINSIKAFEAKLVSDDCLQVLKSYLDNFFDFIVRSPSYTDRRSKTNGGIETNRYVDWFAPCCAEFFQVLKPTDTFIFNIKEKVVVFTTFI